MKGIALLLIGLSDASRTFTDDLAHKQLRVGHGLIIIGAFAILGALPHLIDGLEAGKRFLDSRGEKAGPVSTRGAGPRRRATGPNDPGRPPDGQPVDGEG